MSEESAHELDQSRAEPIIDYVLKFEAVPSCYVGPSERLPQDIAQERIAEYERLISKIRSLGLTVTSRHCLKDDGFVLIFVAASNRLLCTVREKEKKHDFIHGVLDTASPAASDLSTDAGAVVAEDGTVISPADKIRYVHTLLTASEDPFGQQNGAICGAEIQLGHGLYPHVVDMFSLQDSRFNRAWLQRWKDNSLRSILFGITNAHIETIRFHFGEQVALYFAFLNIYYTWLLSPAVLGLLFWYKGNYYSPIYSFILLLWACVFVHVWRIRERKLAVRWGVAGSDAIGQRHPRFRPRKILRDPASGERYESYEWWRREFRTLLGVPVTLLFATLLVFVLTANFFVEIITAEVYRGPYAKYVAMIPTVLFSLSVPAAVAVSQTVAAWLAEFENYATVQSYDAGITYKTFLFSALVTYGPLALTAFVYIPFGDAIVQFLASRGYLTAAYRFLLRQPKFVLPSKLHFSVNPTRLHSQLFALATTAQISNMFSELVLPVLLRVLVRAKSKFASREAKEEPSAPSRVSFASDRVEVKFLQRVRAEMALPVYHEFADYAEMAAQFGGVVVWSVIWPLSPVMAFVNNWFELRTDSLKIMFNTRRPVPVRKASIGPWLTVLFFLIRIAVFTNASLNYLFEDNTVGEGVQHTVATRLRSYIHPESRSGVVKECDFSGKIGGVLPFFLPNTGRGGALVASFVLAILVDQAFGIVRLGVHHLVEQIMWTNSPEATKVRTVQFRNRRTVVESTELTEKRGGLYRAAHLQRGERVHPDMSFWDPLHNTGANFITSLSSVAKTA
ncbi:hypothetical protein MVES1_002073 [Malassezia vespertilionis]|nr:uncharacterized protein MVES1_002073 [Malassezia vespertilionis]WFD06719.1 hypothetical protein MVES1_002073 [Malassezia vespertilionis]